MERRLLELIPEFELIEDAELRRRTLDAFLSALRRGGWTPDDLTRMPFTLLIEPCPANMVQHVRAVTRAARAAAVELSAMLGEAFSPDMDVLTSGALLHDVGKLLEYEERDGAFVKSRFGALLRHPFSGVAVADEAGLPAEVQHIIAVHSKEGDHSKRSPEAFIVYYADYMSFQPLRG